MLFGSTIVLFLNIEGRYGVSVLLANRRLQVLIARELLHRCDWMFQFNTWGSALGDQPQRQLRRPDFQHRAVLTHIGIADDEMEPPVFVPNRVGLVPRIKNWPIVHCIDAQIRFHKISPLRQLIVAWHESGLLSLYADFSCSCKDLPADKKRQ